MRNASIAAAARFGRLAIALLAGALLGGCPSDSGPNDNGGNNGGNDGGGRPTPKVFSWQRAFDPAGVAALSGVWGSSPSDVFVVGGTDQQGEIYHFDGSTWRAMNVPPVGLLIWVFGFAPTDVWAVGVRGAIVRYNGKAWTQQASPTSEDLWGIWGPAPNDVWIVGGTIGLGSPELIQFDGDTFAAETVPPNDRNASALFKVWGISGRVFAVGQNGLVIGYDGSAWSQMDTGPNADDDFVSLWGTSATNIVAVGGRASARVATFNGTSWNTSKPANVPGLNAVFMTEPSVAIVGGVSGFCGQFDPLTGQLTQEDTNEIQTIHAAWSDGAGKTYGVGGRFSPPFAGLALVRAEVGTVIDVQRPQPAVGENPPITDCNANGVADAQDIASGASRDCDANGVPDECEPDADADGVPDACDRCPGANDAADADGDTVPDGCDRCPGANDAADADGDTVPDGCDRCPGQDDRLDSDGDGVPNACDLCQGHDDRLDGDGDGVPNACDLCPAGDDRLDSDGDGVPNACDDCTGDDQVDSDADGVADACDVCPGANDALDADGDGVPNGCDICALGDDRIDTDSDGIPNACDSCPNGDNALDQDGDTVPDACDQCPGKDDRLDADGDGTPDDCDCDTLLDCPLGSACIDGVCTPSSAPDIEIGTYPPFVRLVNGQTFDVTCGIQGFTDAEITIRGAGFPQNAEITVKVSMKLVSNGQEIAANLPFPTDFVWNEAAQVNELIDEYIFIQRSKCEIDGKEVDLRVTVTYVDNPMVMATTVKRVKLRSVGPFCPLCP